MKQKTFFQLFLWGLVALAIAAGTIFYAYKTGRIKIERQVAVSPASDPTTSWKTYKSTKYNYSFKYPPGWSLNSEDPKPVEVASVSSGKYIFNIGKPPYDAVWLSITNVPTPKEDGENEEQYEPAMTIVHIDKYKQNGGTTLLISGQYWKYNKDRDIAKKIIEQIASTFEFSGNE